MAMLTPQQLDDIRQAYTREHGVGDVIKPRINAANQAIEDTFASGAVQTALNNAINTATSPAVLTAAQKRLLVRWWLQSKFLRGNN